LNETSVRKIFAETGVDVTPWPTEKHFGSWVDSAPATKSPAAGSSPVKPSPPPIGPPPLFAWPLMSYSTQRVPWELTTGDNKPD